MLKIELFAKMSKNVSPHFITFKLNVNSTNYERRLKCVFKDFSVY